MKESRLLILKPAVRNTNASVFLQKSVLRLKLQMILTWEKLLFVMTKDAVPNGTLSAKKICVLRNLNVLSMKNQYW